MSKEVMGAFLGPNMQYLEDVYDQGNDVADDAETDKQSGQKNTDTCKNRDSETVLPDKCEGKTITPTEDKSQDHIETDPAVEEKVNDSVSSPAEAASFDIKYQETKFIVSIPENLIRDLLPKSENQMPLEIELKEEKVSEPIYPVKIIPSAQKLRIPSIEELSDFLKNGQVEWAIPGKTEEKIFIFADPPTCDTWFISDIHGDMLAMERCIRYIDEQTPQANIIFLGDMFDRGPDSMNCTAALLGLIKDRPGRILWLAGNHDLGLRWNDEKQEFTGAVTPAEFADFLNAEKEKYAEFGQELIKFIQKLPYALFFNDGLIAVHGGIPFNDRKNKPLDEIENISQFAQPGMKERFIWARFSTAKAKIYQKKDSDFGFDNFAGFCEKMYEFTNVRYNRIICGHQHFPGFTKSNRYPDHVNEQGICIYSSCKREMWADDGECVEAVIAKYRKGLIPETHILQITAENARKYFSSAKISPE